MIVKVLLQMEKTTNTPTEKMDQSEKIKSKTPAII